MGARRVCLAGGRMQPRTVEHLRTCLRMDGRHCLRRPREAAKGCGGTRRWMSERESFIDLVVTFLPLLTTFFINTGGRRIIIERLV